jgi:hypothetical protein
MFWNSSDKTGYFNTEFVFYSVNIQPDIIQIGYKNIWENHIFFKNNFWKFFGFFLIRPELDPATNHELIN